MNFSTIAQTRREWEQHSIFPKRVDVAPTGLAPNVVRNMNNSRYNYSNNPNPSAIPSANPSERGIPIWLPMRPFDTIERKTRYDGSSSVDISNLHGSINDKVFGYKKNYSIDDIRKARLSLEFKGRGDAVNRNFHQISLTQPNMHQVIISGGNNYKH